MAASASAFARIGRVAGLIRVLGVGTGVAYAAVAIAPSTARSATARKAVAYGVVGLICSGLAAAMAVAVEAVARSVSSPARRIGIEGRPKAA